MQFVAREHTKRWVQFLGVDVGAYLSGSHFIMGGSKLRNILSFSEDVEVTGQEILDWARYQIENNTEHKKMAKVVLRRFGDIRPNSKYTVRLERTPWILNAKNNK